MSRNWSRAAAFVLAAGFMGVGVDGTAQAPPPTVPAWVTATDREGRTIPDLRTDDLGVRVDGRPIAVASLAPSRHPLTAVVILDTSASMRASAPAMLDAAAALLLRLESADRAKVGSFSDGMLMSAAFTSSKDVLLGQLKALGPGQTTPFFDALVASADALKAEPGHRIVVALTDGEDSASRASFSAALDALHARDVTVIGVGVESVRARGATVVRSRPHRDLARLVEETGGSYVELTRRVDVNAEIDRIVGQLRSQYLLTFVPPGLDEKRHKLEIVTTRPGVSLRARKGYVTRAP